MNAKVDNIRGYDYPIMEDNGRRYTQESIISSIINFANTEPIDNNYSGIPSYSFDGNTYNSNGKVILGAMNADGIRVASFTKYMYRRKSPIQYIVLHYTAGTQSRPGAAEGTLKVLNDRKLSSDFIVDDRTIIQVADDPALWRASAIQRWNSNGTLAGKNCCNDNCVSIEMCSTLDKGYDWKPNVPGFRFTQEVLNNTAALCRKLMRAYNIPKSNIIRHYDIMGKCCPGIIGWNLGPGSGDETLYRNFVKLL